MSPRGRIPDSDREDRGTGHRSGVGRGKQIEVLPVEQKLVGADPPPELSPIAQEIWEICIADMATLGHLRAPDLLLLRGYCETAAIMIEAEACIREYGAMMREPILATDPETLDVTVVGYRLQANPAVKQHGEAVNRLRLLSNEIMLNPLARIRGNLLEVATSSIALDVVNIVSKKLEAIEAKEAAAAKKAKAKKRPAKKPAAKKPAKTRRAK